jgi:hypothetical protein
MKCSFTYLSSVKFTGAENQVARVLVPRQRAVVDLMRRK